MDIHLKKKRMQNILMTCPILQILNLFNQLPYPCSSRSISYIKKDPLPNRVSRERYPKSFWPIKDGLLVMFICDIVMSFSIKCITHNLMTSWINDAYVIRYTHGWFKSLVFGAVWWVCLSLVLPGETPDFYVICEAASFNFVRFFFNVFIKPSSVCIRISEIVDINKMSG